MQKENGLSRMVDGCLCFLFFTPMKAILSNIIYTSTHLNYTQGLLIMRTNVSWLTKQQEILTVFLLSIILNKYYQRAITI